MTKLHENFCSCYLGPWLGHFLTTMQNVVHFQSVDDVTFSHNGANTDTGIGELFTVTRQVAPGRSLLSAIALFLPVSVLLLLCIVLFYTPTVLSELRLIITDLANFWATVVKRFALCYRTVVLSVLSVLSVYNVGILWPNGRMDPNETLYGGRPRPLPHCVRWGPSSPQKGHDPSNFWPMYVVVKGLNRSRCYLVRRYASAQATLFEMGIQLPLKGAQHSIFRPRSIVAKRSPISATAELLYYYSSALHL